MQESDLTRAGVLGRSDGGLTVIIPALNEVESILSTLGELVPECRTHGWTVIVVDDGSNDGTSQAVSEAWPDDVQLVRHKLPRGYGAAIKSGMARASTEFIATFDADGQHDPTDLTRLLSHAKETDADMVIGNRGAYASSLYRRFGKWIIRRIANLLLPISVQDLNTGIRVLRTDIARSYSSFLPDAPAFCDVVTLAFISEKRAVRELPVSIRPRSAGTSKMSTATGLDTVIQILNIVTLFNPMRVFIPLAVLAVVVGVLWGTPYVVMGRGVCRSEAIPWSATSREGIAVLPGMDKPTQSNGSSGDTIGR